MNRTPGGRVSLVAGIRISIIGGMKAVKTLAADGVVSAPAAQNQNFAIMRPVDRAPCDIPSWPVERAPPVKFFQQYFKST
jgi:hypothetical protein